MDLETIRNLYDNFDTNINVDYKQLVFMYEKYLEQYMNYEELNKNSDFIIYVSVGFDYVNKYFGFDEDDFNFEKLHEFIGKMNEIIKLAYKNKVFDIANLSYALAINCFPFFNDEDESINEQIRLLLIKNSYVINKILLEDKEKTNKMS